MTGNSELISINNLTYVTFSGRSDQTAHANIEIVKIPVIQPLMEPLLDSKCIENLKF